MPSIISLSDIARSKFDRLKKSFSCKNDELKKHIKIAKEFEERH